MSKKSEITKNRNRKEEISELIAPIRNFLQKIIRKKIRTKEDRDALAEHLGIQTSSLSNMLYKGEGGLNLWIAALIYCYDINLNDIIYFFENQHLINGKLDKLDKLDKSWIELGSKLSDKDKKFVLALVEMSIGLHKSLYK